METLCTYLYSGIDLLRIVDQSGPAWHFCCNCPISKPWPVLDFLSKNQGLFFIFPKNQKMSSCDQKWCFLRSTWAHRIRAFGEAHETVRCKKVGHFFHLFLHRNSSPEKGKMIFCTTSVDAYRREVFVRSFGFVVALLVSREIVFCASAQHV